MPQKIIGISKWILKDIYNMTIIDILVKDKNEYIYWKEFF